MPFQINFCFLFFRSEITNIVIAQKGSSEIPGTLPWLSVVFCCWEWQLGGLEKGLALSWAALGCMFGMLQRHSYHGGILSEAHGFVLLCHFPNRGEVLGDHA